MRFESPGPFRHVYIVGYRIAPITGIPKYSRATRMPYNFMESHNYAFSLQDRALNMYNVLLKAKRSNILLFAAWENPFFSAIDTAKAKMGPLVTESFHPQLKLKVRQLEKAIELSKTNWISSRKTNQWLASGEFTETIYNPKLSSRSAVNRLIEPDTPEPWETLTIESREIITITFDEGRKISQCIPREHIYSYPFAFEKSRKINSFPYISSYCVRPSLVRMDRKGRRAFGY